MSLSQGALHEVAQRLYEAERSRVPIAPLIEQYSGIAEKDAYTIQGINASAALRDGKRLVGYKVGLTSAEAQRQFKVFQPDYGHLFDSMAVLEDSAIDLSELIQPKIEGEIAFVLGSDLKGPGVTILDVMKAVDYATTAIEICDSRIAGWKITSVDTIADNGSSARFILSGGKRSISGIDFRSLGMAMKRGGEVVLTGAGSAVMGNPLNAVVFLANELGRHDRQLCAGEVVLSGALSSMLSCAPGDFFTCEILGLGKATTRFVRNER